jgi:tetratricopeptide (TPR) repeat protein
MTSFGGMARASADHLNQVSLPVILTSNTMQFGFMAKDPKKKNSAGSVSPNSEDVRTHEEGKAKTSRWKLWTFRLVAAVGGPIVILGLLEVSLRLSGFGYPTAFLLPISRGPRELLVQNNQFGWRFFGPKLSRLPAPICIAREKPSGTVRIFVLGESAAKGEPQPAFGFPRMLETLLRLRHPGTRFEVVNAAMTAINSHSIVPIARDCSDADGDIWVIYMGNNEVVGPFGAGTIFGRKAPPLPLIRASLALEATRSGQLVDSLVGSLKRTSPHESEWQGMKMFLAQQVSAHDPGMSRVYRNFEKNLEEIISTGRKHGVGVVVSTVAVNLMDCAPFSSAHRNGLSGSELANWDKAYQFGIQAQETAKYAEAVQHFGEAAKIDGEFAELLFREAMCEMVTGKVREAREHFAAARDFDTLRFRCDSNLNEIIRKTAAKYAKDRVLLADSEQSFARRSLMDIPGGDLFYEHVHPNFSGNYVLAKIIGDEVEKLLPPSVATNDPLHSWPLQGDCAQSLGWSEYSWLMAMQDILARVSAPPFTGQANHDMQLRILKGAMDQSSAALLPAGMSAASNACEIALKGAPDDPVLLGQLSYFKKAAGDLEGAVALARRELELLPADSQGWQRLGLILVSQNKIKEAADAFVQAIALDPADVISLQNLGQTLWMAGKKEEAIAKYRRTVKLQPNFAIGWLSLGTVLDEMNRKTEAEECFQKAVACQPSRVTDLVALARFCRSRQWQDAAATNYDKAAKLNPEDPALRIEAGEFLLASQRFEEAGDQFAEAIRLAPKSARAHQLYGTVYGQVGMPAEAEQQFRESLKLDPNLLEARLNLGIALMTQGKSEEALSCLEAVLEKNPTNPLALKYVQALRANAQSPPQK